MELRFVRHWRGHVPGQITCEIPDGVANLIVGNGVAEIVKRRKAKPKKATTRKGSNGRANADDRPNS